MLKEVRLFRTETEYCIPTKEEISVNPEYWFRSTILWKAYLLTDESGTVMLNCPDDLSRGTAMVLVNGISSTNLVGSKRCSYKVTGF